MQHPGISEGCHVEAVPGLSRTVRAAAWTVAFSDELREASWNLLARELSMIMFNPRHPAVIAAGLSLKPAPANPATVISRLSHLRRLARWAEATGLPPQLADW